jgi:beta-xylosidase
MKAKGWDDCCPFWDDDGQGYLIGTNTSGGYQIHLFKMTADGQHLVDGFDKMIHQSHGSEANKLYKINGLYYHYFSEVRAEGRVIMMERAKSLDGPWESQQLNHVSKAIDKEPNQGGLIQLASGDWWFITHQGTGDWEGRAMVLLPITWTDGWPIIGNPGADGIGNMVWSDRKPINGIAAAVPQTSDEFDETALGPQWEWNYQPRAEMWSLTQRPGFLRLHAFKPIKSNDLLSAGNTLTQRAFRTNFNEVTMKLEIAGMADGQQAGLCHLAKAYATLGVSQAGNVRTLTFNDAGKVTNGPVLAGNDLWLRSTWNFAGDSQYSYSTDGTNFTRFGPIYRLTWSYYRGDRLGIFSYNNTADAGFVDVDWFHVTMAAPAAVQHAATTQP